MNGREYQSAVVIKTDTCLVEIRETKKMIADLSFKVNTLLPQTNLQPFSKPAQKIVGRDLNVASWFRSRVATENAKIPANSRKYLEFPADVSEEKLNDDMKRCIHGIMCERLRPGWETKSWHAIYNEDKRLGEQIIKEATFRPEMAVIAPSAGYWAIRTIAEQRQKSTKRSAQQRNARSRKTEGIKIVKNSEVSAGNEVAEEEIVAGAVVMSSGERDVTYQEVDSEKGLRVSREPFSMAEEAVSVVKDIENEELSEDKSGSGESEEDAQIVDSAGTETRDEENGKHQPTHDDITSVLESLSPEEVAKILPSSLITSLVIQRAMKSDKSNQPTVKRTNTISKKQGLKKKNKGDMSQPRTQKCGPRLRRARIQKRREAPESGSKRSYKKKRAE